MRNNKDFGLSDSLIDAVRQVVEKKLDPVDPKELKGKHADRKDKDIDNDGDVDSTDKFLHRRRKAITKAIATKEAMQKPYVSSDRDGHHVMTGSGKISKSFKDTKSAAAHLKKNFTKLQKEDVNEGYEDTVMKALKKKRIDGRFDKGDLFVSKRDVKAARDALKRDFNIKQLPKIVGEDDALIGVAKKLKKASQAHAGQADKIMKHVKDMGEAANPAQQAAIAIAMKKAGKKPKNEGAMKRIATGGGMKTFKPKPPAKSEEKKGKKDMIDVKPSMEASELPKK